MELQRLTDVELLALLIAGEADDQPLEGRVAVACTVVERQRLQRLHYGLNLRDVMLKPYQYSTFNGEHWRRFSPRIGAQIVLAELAIRRLLNTHVNGCTHYHTVAILPQWAKSPLMLRRGQIGQHIFYQEMMS